MGVNIKNEDQQQMTLYEMSRAPGSSKEMLLAFKQKEPDWSLLQTLTWRLKNDENWHRSVKVCCRI